jgi:hypothetical protein
MQRFDASFEHFRKAGDIPDVNDGNVACTQGRSSSAGRQDFPSSLLQKRTKPTTPVLSNTLTMARFLAVMQPSWTVARSYMQPPDAVNPLSPKNACPKVAVHSSKAILHGIRKNHGEIQQ